MKKLAALLLALWLLPMTALAAEGDVEINEVNFPDANFRDFLLTESWMNGWEKIDKDSDGILTLEEQQGGTWLYLYDKGITSLEGIQYFTALKRLTCSQNQLVTLDVSKNLELTELDCSHNKLIRLDVSNNAELTDVDCCGNKLIKLDISGKTKLTKLDCGSNLLTLLNISGCTALQELNCHSNNLPVLDVTGFTTLKTLNCYSNLLSALDVSTCTALTTLNCYSNNLNALNVKGTPLVKLNCHDNLLPMLDVTGNPKLTTLVCDENKLSVLDVSACSLLDWLECDNNQLTELNVSKNPLLSYLSCSENQLVELDTKANEYLTQLQCDDNQLTELDVSQNTALSLLYCSRNPLTTLDVSNNAALRTLYCDWTQLTSLDLSQNLALRNMGCTNEDYVIEVGSDLQFDLANLTAGFDVSRTSNWEDGTVEGTILTVTYDAGNMDPLLSVSYTYDCGNGMTAKFSLQPVFSAAEKVVIDETSFPDSNFRNYVLTKIDKNKDGSLSLEECFDVWQIDLHDRGITTLEGIEHFKMLQSVFCEGNYLRELDVGELSELQSLYCGRNQLLELDVNAQTKLRYLDCENNCLTSLDISDNLKLDLEFVRCDGNKAIVPMDSRRKIDLSKLPDSFDVSRASNWTGGTVKGNILTVKSGANEVTYMYDIGQGKKVKFTLYPTSGAAATLELPENTKEIGEFAFYGNNSIASVILPDGLEIIGKGAFKNCKNLVRIRIPNSVISIADDAFEGCDRLTIE